MYGKCPQITMMNPWNLLDRLDWRTMYDVTNKSQLIEDLLVMLSTAVHFPYPHPPNHCLN